MTQLEKCTKISHKIDTPPAKPRESVDDNGKDSKKERLDRYRPAIFYDDDDENTSKPKLEKLINQDKERIEQERKQQLDKKKAKKDTTRDERSKQKMEPSADKFKKFLFDDTDEKSPDQPNTSSANVKVDKNEDVIEINDKSPAKLDLTTNPQASQSKSPDTKMPPAWKVKNKRQSTSNDESASKRSRKLSSSSESDSSNDVQVDQLLRGVVFVISGIQVSILIEIMNPMEINI